MISLGGDDSMPSEYESSLVRAGRVLSERWWIVVLAALACVVSALAVSLTSTKQYEASATLLFRDPRLSEALFGAQVFEPSADPARDSSTNVELVRSNQVADAVRRRLGLRRSTEEVSDQVTVEAQSNADLVDVTVRDPDPTVAASMADAFAAEYVSFRQRADRAKIAQGERLLRERIATLPDRASDERGQLQAALEKLIALEAVQTGNAEPIDRAVVPTAAVSPKPLRDAGLALAVGLLLGVGVSLMLEALDRRVKSVEEFERLYGQRAVAIVPQDGLSGPTQKQAWVSLEPYQMIRSRIDYRSRSAPIRTVLVTSADAAEGKTTVAVNLARAAAAGQVVVLIEADLRRPTFDRHFALEGEKRGLSNALMGVEPVRDLLQHVGGPSGGLFILPSGPIPAVAVDLLQGQAMRDVLETWSKWPTS